MPGTKEVLAYVDAYQDFSFAQERNKSDLFLTAGVFCKRVREIIMAEGRLDEQRGWGRGVALGHLLISRGFSAEAPLALSSDDSCGEILVTMVLINRRHRVRRASVGDLGTSALLCIGVRFEQEGLKVDWPLIFSEQLVIRL